MVCGLLEHDASLNHLNSSSADGSVGETGAAAVPAFADVRDVGKAHVLAYENVASSRWFITAENSPHLGVFETIREMQPKFASNVPDPASETKVETFQIYHSHAERDLGVKFSLLEKTIGDMARRLANLVEART